MVKNLIIICSFFFLGINSYGQSHSPEPGKPLSNWWFGASLGLDFNSNNNLSYFSLGLFPIAGYKITPDLSVGPRIGFSMENYRQRIGGTIIKGTFFDLSGAAFMRYKFLKVIFAHAEFEVLRGQDREYDIRSQSFLKKPYFDQNGYVGLGYNSMGLIGSEIYILYNFLNDPNSIHLPFQVRAGLTYNF